MYKGDICFICNKEFSMSIWSSIIGGAAGGAILGGPIGAIIGAVAGHYIGKRIGDGAGVATDQITFTIGVIALSAKMAKADGYVSREEIDAFKQAFQVPEGEMKNVARVFNMARKEATGFEPYARQLAKLFRDKPAMLEELLNILFSWSSCGKWLRYSASVKQNLIGCGRKIWGRSKATPM